MSTPVLARKRHFTSALAVGLIATAAAFVQAPAQADPMGGHRHGGGMMGGGAMMGGLLHGRALDAINASAEQRAQIKQIADAARADLRTLHEASRTLHQQARALFTQPTVDANAAEVLRQQMLAQHDQASKRMLQAMLEASRVLTPEQRAKLAELQSQWRERMEQRRGQGR